jgi:nitroreductase/NAD-dependent dihydropyrimidine dehydrogenase PreA subunit
MSWIEIDADLCTGCETCLTVCGRGCYTMVEGVAQAQADETNCSLCGHCVAVCPTNAVVHHQMNMEEFKPQEGPNDISAERFIRFIRKRRSHRFFQDREVPWDVLTQLVDVCRYAPTGSNMQMVEVLAIYDRQKIHRLSELTVEYFRQNMLAVEKEIAALEAAGKEIPVELAGARDRIPMTRRHLATWESGGDPILRAAPVVLVFHCAPNPSTPKDDCVIAAHTVTLTAMTMGLETCYIGLLEKAAAGSAKVFEALELPSDHTVYSVLIAGYPEYEFPRPVARKPIRITRI